MCSRPERFSHDSLRDASPIVRIPSPLRVCTLDVHSAEPPVAATEGDPVGIFAKHRATGVGQRKLFIRDLH